MRVEGFFRVSICSDFPIVILYRARSEGKPRRPLRTFESIFREENLISVHSEYVHRVASEKLSLET